MLNRQTLIGISIGVLAIALSAVAFVLVSTEREQITAQITQNALQFTELSAERVAELYDLYYRAEADALFNFELASLLGKVPAIERVELATAEGELLFSSEVMRGESLPLLTDPVLLARLRVNKLSLATAERVVYLTPVDLLTHAAAYRSSDPEGNTIAQLQQGDRISTIIYPLADERRRVIFHLSYEEVGGRINETMIYLTLLLIFGLAGSFFIAHVLHRGHRIVDNTQ